MSAVEVVESRWTGDGSFAVTVAGPWPHTTRGARAARDKARAVDSMRQIQWTRLNRVTLAEPAPDAPLRALYHFTASRLGREYR